MRKDFSFGVVPVRRTSAGAWEVLLVQHREGGHWDFPKGHPEADETPKETAARELKEETNLAVAEWLPVSEQSITYASQRNGESVDKTVTFFPALVEGVAKYQEREMQDLRWVTALEARDLITYDNSRQVLAAVLAELI